MRTRMLVAVLAAALAGAAPATAATGDAALAKQVRQLNRKVAVLQTRLNAVDTTVSGLRSANDALAAQLAFVGDRDTCTTAITWDGLDLLVGYLTGAVPTPLDDHGACQRAGIPRTPPAALAHGWTGGLLDGLARLAALVAPS